MSNKKGNFLIKFIESFFDRIQRNTTDRILESTKTVKREPFKVPEHWRKRRETELKNEQKRLKKKINLDLKEYEKEYERLKGTQGSSNISTVDEVKKEIKDILKGKK